jgi:hypothetical protein
MFKVILETQWKWVRLPLLVATVAAFAIPVLSVQDAGRVGTRGLDPYLLLIDMTGWGVAYPLLAAGIGLLLAMTAWGPDHRQGHSYALSLPIPRWRFAMLRLGAGSVLLAMPIIGITAGSFAATAAAAIPVGLTAYPAALAIRFTLAAGLAYSVFFAISAGSTRTAGYILAGMSALIVAHTVFGLVPGVDLMGAILERLYDWPGPLAIFGGRWMLIDV